MISGRPNVPRQYLGVMVSGTFRDLQEHRAVLKRAIEGQGLHPVTMEQDAALPEGTVVDASLRKVQDASAYVGIIGRLYGQIPESDDNPERLSLTELEFREARRLGRPILIFIMGSDHAVLPAAVEQEPEKIQKLDAFREEVKRATAGSPVHRVYREFNDLADFSVAATQSLAELRRHLDARSVPAVLWESARAARTGGPPPTLDPFAFGVHRSVVVEQLQTESVLPPYLPRQHDEVLRSELAQAGDQSRIVMVVGGSSTGKTRACWEAVHAVLPGWHIWYPLTPQRPEAVLRAVDEATIAPRTVIWLNEAQLYLRPTPVGERVAAALHQLLGHEQGPRLHPPLQPSPPPPLQPV